MRYKETGKEQNVPLGSSRQCECDGATTAVNCVGNFVSSSPFGSFSVHQPVGLRHVCEL